MSRYQLVNIKHLFYFGAIFCKYLSGIISNTDIKKPTPGISGNMERKNLEKHKFNRSYCGIICVILFG